MYLLEHPNPHHSDASPHWYTTRRRAVLAIVVHITAGLEDLDGVDDDSAEATARYAATTTRRVSWHSGSDTDSALDLLPAGYTAFHVRGYNSSTYGHEISKRDPSWNTAPADWTRATIDRAAAHLGPRARALGVPARHATRAELDRAIAAGGPPVGFIGHDVLDPDRRRDPGRVAGVDTFPWAAFLDAVRRTCNPQEVDMLMVRNPKGAVLLVTGGVSLLIKNTTELTAHKAAGIPLVNVGAEQFRIYETIRAA